MVRSWYEAELARMTPHRRASFHRLLQHPEAIVVPASFLIFVVFAVEWGDGDATAFRQAASQMIGSGFFDVFRDEWLQIGPLYLVPLGLANRLVEPLSGTVVAGHLLLAVQGALVVWLAMGTTKRAARLGGSPDLLSRWVVGGVLAAGGAVQVALEWGHPEEVALALLVVESGMLLRRGSALCGGALLGIAVGVKVWAAIGVGVLLLPRRTRRVLGACAVAAVVVVASYLPFAVLGEFDTFRHVWHFADDTLLGWLEERTGLSEWLLAASQGLVAGLAGLIVARRRWSSPTLLAVVVIAVRLVLEPRPSPYYVCPAVAATLVWLWTTRAPMARQWRALITVFSLLPIQLRTVLVVSDLKVAWLVMVALAASFAIVAEIRAHGPGTSAAAPPSPEPCSLNYKAQVLL